MKQLKKILFTVLPVLMISISACTKGDLTKPTIKIVKPINYDELEIGKAIDLEIIFTDDVGLQGYDIDIHWGEDHDSHSVISTSTPKVIRNSSKAQEEGKKKFYNYKKSFKITGKEVRIKREDIIIDANSQPGKYHFGITCVDENGNSSVAWLNDLHLVLEE